MVCTGPKPDRTGPEPVRTGTGIKHFLRPKTTPVGYRSGPEFSSPVQVYPIMDRICYSAARDSGENKQATPARTKSRGRETIPAEEDLIDDEFATKVVPINKLQTCGCRR